MQFIDYYTENRIGYITLNRPEKRNALNYEVISELKEAFDLAESDDDCKVIILKANGDVFCAGADLSYLQSLQDNTFEDNLNDSTHLAHLFYQIYTLRKMVIAQVQGPAIAGGCGLATVCDIIFASPSATFGYTEVKIGFIPAIVSVFLLRKIGETHTKQLLLSGDLLSAVEARDIGLLTYVVPAEELDEQVYAYARKICQQNSLQSIELTKDLIAHIQDMDLQRGLGYAAERNAYARETLDCRRGIASFLNKQKITW